MKALQFLTGLALTAVGFTACNSYETSPNGLKYKIFDGGSKDSTKQGYVLKMNMRLTLNGSKDSVMADTYGKMPMFAPIQAPPPPGQPFYDPAEVFGMLKKGDSMVAVMYIDSMISKGIAQEASLPPYIKKGDKMTFTYKVLEVFKTDSIAREDFNKELAKDAPRREKEQKDMMEKMRKEQAAKQKAEEQELEKSGEKAKQIQAVQKYLADKKLSATQTKVGSFIKIDQQGSGEQVADGKYITVKYNGKSMRNDSTFDANTMTVKLGEQPFIIGFEDGLRQFKKGGKGTIYIPGYLAYGKEGMGGKFQPYEPLYFDVEITNVSDDNPNAVPQAHKEGDGHKH
ncbi:FKBP-type peptidyl-prolyl cis-trans isomerase [Niabella insulamsoli]|uniref:FKBP-type peptidyl-prolyl cis-trans isomerase n=1 Tax=Niabella insulamsoli TaxID=3144874 RepID=UPI0031FE0FB2